MEISGTKNSLPKVQPYGRCEPFFTCGAPASTLARPSSSVQSPRFLVGLRLAIQVLRMPWLTAKAGAQPEISWWARRREPGMRRGSAP